MHERLALHTCKGATGNPHAGSVVWQKCISALHLCSVALLLWKAICVAGFALPACSVLCFSTHVIRTLDEGAVLVFPSSFVDHAHAHMM